MEPVTQFRQYGNYLPWEHGFLESSGHYKKGEQIIFCYANHYNGKTEQIETRYPIDCIKANNQKRKEFE